MTTVSESVLICAIFAITAIVIGIAYLIYLARLGKPLTIRFSGYGVNLQVGQHSIIRNKRDEGEG